MKSLGCFLLLLFSLPVLHAQNVEQPAFVFDAGGGTATGGTFRAVQSIGQGMTTPLQQSMGTLHQDAGFMVRHLLLPTLDSDGDGLPDELDADNDNDGLDDDLETAGTAFNPTTPTDLNDADSDDDGSSDAQEAMAGFNPLDPLRTFSLQTSQITPQGLLLRWQARAGNSYQLFRFDPNDPLNTRSNLVTRTPLSGSGPWQETEVEHTLPLAPAPAPYDFFGVASDANP